MIKDWANMNDATESFFNVVFVYIGWKDDAIYGRYLFCSPHVFDDFYVPEIAQRIA